MAVISREACTRFFLPPSRHLKDISYFTSSRMWSLPRNGQRARYIGRRNERPSPSREGWCSWSSQHVELLFRTGDTNSNPLQVHWISRVTCISTRPLISPQVFGISRNGREVPFTRETLQGLRQAVHIKRYLERYVLMMLPFGDNYTRRPILVRIWQASRRRFNCS